jgi:hypothetical protein
VGSLVVRTLPPPPEISGIIESVLLTEFIKIYLVIYLDPFKQEFNLIILESPAPT